MTEIHRHSFEKCALASGLLTPQQLDAVRASLRKTDGNGQPALVPSDRAISEKFVELGLLNPWQAKQLLDGRTKFTLGPYRIVDSIGQGGMGHVYKAEDPFLKRFVAIKVLPREKSTPEAIANFTREIQALSSLNHTKLVRAVDAGYDGSVNYMVTEYVPGSDLRKLVRRTGPLSMEAAANIISQVAEGLDHAHQQGIVHRDVKPGNVLVTPEGDAKLSDLGLAGPMYGNGEDDPRYGKIVGTADYLSPDHIQSPWSPVPTWDIYSLGCTLYYAVTGKVPFPGGTTSDKARAHCELKPLDPRRLNHQLSDEFVDLIADLMAKDPAQRVPTAQAVIERLAPWAREFQTQRQMATSAGAVPPVVAVERGPGVSLMATTPAEPIAPPVAPASPPLPEIPAGEEHFEVPVVAPPVVARPEASWNWEGKPEAPPAFAESLLRDTLPDLPTAFESHSSSQDSMSLIVDAPRQTPLWIWLALVLTPIVVTGLALLIAWLRDVSF